jgi:hypothetical protein
MSDSTRDHTVDNVSGFQLNNLGFGHEFVGTSDWRGSRL